ncbi:hypothetical protein LTR97_006847 [Elasticomyces elasticus]|uniref:Heterokaryon incompatibility domain-containing protein n=1 Tax=Elasticomyces elasticus TaxID=574655 RepID=A0AAN7W5J4_9PEZI|nr:hypothetical protein LTR97_006847 [Elasticomyces elasticus]
MATSPDTAPLRPEARQQKPRQQTNVNRGSLNATVRASIGLRYRPLDQARFEIRLLKIERQIAGKKGTARLKCRLIYVSLIDPPHYIALSYCWGTRVASPGISIDGEDVAVTSSLLVAFRELRKRGVRLVWADAICINQADLYEKAAQIQLMGRIYARATGCVAWLGKTDVSSRSAFAMLDAADSLEANSTGSSRVQPDSVRDATFNSVRAILARPYWQRKWILQEVAKAKSVQLWCGPDQADLEHVLDVLLPSGGDAGGLRLTSKSRDLLQSLRLLRAQEQGASCGTPRKGLAWALVYTRRSRVTDARDAIYSLLGLTSDGIDMVPTPNYVESAADVFAMTSRTIMKQQNQVVLLLLARRNEVVSDGESTVTPLKLPSWVPNFAELPKVLPSWIVQAMERANGANKGSPITLHLTTGSPLRNLTVVGVVLSRVTQVEGMPSHQAERSTKLGWSHDDQDPYFSSGRAYGILHHLFETVVSCSMTPSFRFSKKHALVFAELTLASTLETGLAVSWFEGVKSMQVFDKTIEQWVAQYATELERSLENERGHEQSLPKRVRRAIISFAKPKDRLHSERQRAHEEQELSSLRAELERGLQTIADGNMRLVVTSEGKFMLAYTNVRPDDLVCLLQGCSLRVILRSTNLEGQYTYVGEVFGCCEYSSTGSKPDRQYSYPMPYDYVHRILVREDQVETFVLV